METTLAVVQSIGKVPCFSEAWKNSVNVGVNSFASVLSSLVGMRSGPVALCSLSEDSNLCMPFGVIVVFHLWVWANAFIWNGGYIFVLCEY